MGGSICCRVVDALASEVSDMDMPERHPELQRQDKQRKTGTASPREDRPQR
jgi:hypothetical protein